MAEESVYYHLGTHRVRPPEETLEWVLPRAPLVGVTRLADVTWLDDVGIHTYQAHRPNARSLTVSQGKGVSPSHAKVSALMECIELAHAEQINLPRHRASVREMRKSLPYRVEDLDRHRYNTFHDDLVLDWVPAKSVVSGEQTYVPLRAVHLDFSLPWQLPVFSPSSNGLASGNTLDEALVHSLCEIIERDCKMETFVDGKRQPEWIDLENIPDGTSAALLEMFRARNNVVAAAEITSEIGVPAFYASAWSPAHQLQSSGWGCHPDPDVALSRALTEAAQSRLAMISGTRDDIEPSVYTFLHNHMYDPPPVPADVVKITEWEQRPIVSDFAAEAKRLATLIEKHTGNGCVYLDLTRDDVGVPVVRSVAAGMHYQ